AAPQRALTRCRIGTLYMVNGCFLEPNQILAQAGQLKDIPGIIVQGRFDVLTPPDVVSQVLLAIPMWLLFEAGIIFGNLLVPKDPESKSETEV
ncbi:hypothetical protein OAN00_06095, partial [Pseudomonadales bacterium]|nr:hypothetical protein [Pseudomonadales bacterium]